MTVREVLELVGARRPALLIGLSAAILATLATYYQIRPLGPLPNLYDPVWYPEKVLSVAAESIAALGALALIWLTRTKVGVARRLSRRMW